MNEKDRRRLFRLKNIIESVPFSKSGTATQTGYGSIMYEEDMRAIRPQIQKAIEGMICENIEGLEEGFDFQNPDQTLTATECWIEKRKKEGWENASRYSFEEFMQSEED